MKTNYMLWIGLGIGILGGIVLGMMIQQMIFTASAVEFGESLEGTTFNLEIDLNETQLIEGFKKEFLPLFNQTIQENNLENEI